MTSFLALFLQLQLFVAAGALFAWLLRRFVRWMRHPIQARAELRIHYLLFLLVILSPLGSFANFSSPWKPVVRVMAESRPAFPAGPEALPAAVVLLGKESRLAPSVPLPVLGALTWLALLSALAFVLLDYLRLRKMLNRCWPIRKIGKVQVLAFPGDGSPFSVRTLRACYVVLPETLLGLAEARLAIAHEIQHHRQGDTLWCHAFSVLRIFSFYHPLLRLWGAVVSEGQELACDEALVSSQKKGKGRKEYAECLILAAETAVKGRAGRANAAAPAFFSDRRMLMRRIENMYRAKTKNRYAALLLGTLITGGMAASALAVSQPLLVDSRISRGEAERMAENARRESEFPIAVNDDVLHYLNHFLGSVKGREYLRASLARMEALRPRLAAKLAAYGAPPELLAVGLIESGFRNLPSSENKVSGAAGIWQFIASTARVFGLRVNDAVDERLDIDKETDAAFRYLTANKLRFNDWLLGVMAYNMGERALDAAIRKAGTRDPWELVKRGYENDSDYLPKFMAAVLILKNPQALK